jgi:hypothetical protein
MKRMIMLWSCQGRRCNSIDGQRFAMKDSMDNFQAMLCGAGKTMLPIVQSRKVACMSICACLLLNCIEWPWTTNDVCFVVSKNIHRGGFSPCIVANSFVESPFVDQKRPTLLMAEIEYWHNIDTMTYDTSHTDHSIYSSIDHDWMSMRSVVAI